MGRMVEGGVGVIVFGGGLSGDPRESTPAAQALLLAVWFFVRPSQQALCCVEILGRREKLEEELSKKKRTSRDSKLTRLENDRALFHIPELILNESLDHLVIP